MRKFLLVCLVVIVTVMPPVFADNFDIAFSFGAENYKWWNDGISFSYGMNFGFTPRFEIDLWGISDLIPTPFKSNMFGIDFTFSLLGRRSSGTIVAGSGINMLMSVGAFYRTDNNGAGPIISITPLTVGSPITTKRERLLKTGVGWDFVNNELVVTFSLMNFDYYVRGTYRDYEY